jgi:hypothetical protein
MSQQGTPNALVLQGFDAAGQSVYRLQLSVVEFPKAKHLWDDQEFIRSHRIARLLGDLFDEHGAMEQQYERHYDATGRYLGGTINYADGRKLTAHTSGLESSAPSGSRVEHILLDDRGGQFAGANEG